MPAENEPAGELGKITPRVLRPSREPAIRLQVVVIWAFIALAVAITRQRSVLHFLEVSSIAVLAFFLLPFVDGPIRLHSRGKRTLHADYKVASVAPPARTDYRTAHVQSLGFEFAARIIQSTRGSNVAVRLDLFVHEENKDSAQVADVVSGLRDLPMVVFKSRFEDGFAFETSNTQGARIFKGDPNFLVFRFPAVRSIPDLYRLHRKLKEQFGVSRRAVMADKPGEAAEFIARAEIAHQRISQCGDYELSKDGSCHIHTWRGAFRQSWLLAWPVKQVRALKLVNRSLRMAERLGMPINVKLGCLQDSLPRHVSAASPQRRRL